ncbi:transposase [Bradyrhizobium sp. LB7.2]
MLIIPVEPHVDESLAGFVARATARNHLRRPLGELRELGITKAKLGSLCNRSPSLAPRIAAWAGVKDVDAIKRMFSRSLDERKGWVDFHGEPLRAMYRQPGVRRIAPATLKKKGFIKAVWGLLPLSFDPVSKEKLIDACPECKRSLGWTRTYGVAFCDYCSKPKVFDQFTWDYPAVDLRDYPQPKVEVEDEEALNFLTSLIDPSPDRKAGARKLVPDMWSGLSGGDLFEMGVTFASMLNVDHWDNRQTVRRKAKAGKSWDWLTPRMLAIGGRAIMDDQRGFEAFGDILRKEAVDRPRTRRYGKWAEIGPLSIVDPSLCKRGKEILRDAAEKYVAARRDPDMLPLQTLADKFGLDRRGLKSLADSGLVPTSKTEGVRRGPVLMSLKVLQPLIVEKEACISETRAAPAIGLHPMHLQELARRGLLELVDGRVLLLMKAECYYTRASLDTLVQRIAASVKKRATPACIRLRVALRACENRAVPWPGLLEAILDGRLEVFEIESDRSRRGLGDRLAVRGKESLSSLVQELNRNRGEVSAWIGNAAASEILGVNETVVWSLVKAGGLQKHDEAPLYLPFKRDEVESVKTRLIFTSEITSAGRFNTYRKASAWLREQSILPRFELKRGGWKVYVRTEVEAKLRARIDALISTPAPPPRPKAPRHGPESPSGKLAAEQERLNAAKIGHATAAAILGGSIFAVQKLVARGDLKEGKGSTPFHRANVEALARRIVFLPEVMRISGYISQPGVKSWLELAGLRPLFSLKKGGVSIFDRATIEDHAARTEFVPGEHPRWIKRKLLGMVDRGNSVHQASIMCGVSYATGKRWASTAKPHGAVRGNREPYPFATKRKLIDMVNSGLDVRHAAVKCGVHYATAKTWTKDVPRTSNA